MAEPGGPSFASFFGGSRRIPRGSFYAYLFSGAAVDVLAFWLPGAGDVFILWCRGWYWLNGYKTEGMGMATGADMAVEAIPIMEALPGATAFVIWSYVVNVLNTEGEEEPIAGSSLIRRISQLNPELAGAQAIAGRLPGGGAHAPQGGGGAGDQIPQKNPEESETRRRGEPLSPAADKNTARGPQERDRLPRDETGNPRMTGYQSTPGVDGVRPPEPYVPRQPIFRKQPANETESETQHAA